MLSGQNSFMKWYRGFIQGKTRIVIAWLFGVILVLAAKNYPTWPGILLCLNGAILRFWASGYLHKDSKLTIAGPYAYVRNPLFLGTFLMAVGTALAIEKLELTLLVGCLFGVIYHFIILDEETKLARLFGEAYIQYCKIVPRFFPRLLPARWNVLNNIHALTVPDTRTFSFAIAWQNKAYEAFAAFFGLMGFVTLSAFLWQRLMD